MGIEKLIRRLRNDADAYRNGETLGRAFADQEDVLDNAATALSTLQAENAQLRAELEQVKQESDAAVEAVKNMAEYIVCAGRVDYYLCDEISQEHHLKYQPKNDGNYDNEPCYKCIADWFLQGHKWQENCW